MSYAILILWNERTKFFPAILSVGVSAVLVAIQLGLLAGMLSFTSLVIDNSPADIWIGIKDVPTIDVGVPVPESWLQRFGGLPEIKRVESFCFGYAASRKDSGGTVVCCVVGSRLDDAALGCVRGLPSQLRHMLYEPDTIVVDATELGRLGLTSGIGETLKIGDIQLRVVGLTKDYKSVGGPFIFCSEQTSRRILAMFAREPHGMTYWLLESHDENLVPSVICKLKKRYDDMAVISRQDFSRLTQRYWLTRSRAGIAMGFTTVMSLLVSLAVTSQTLFSATQASIRQYATLNVLGISRRHIGLLVIYQSMGVGLIGISLSIPIDFALTWLASFIGAKVLLNYWLIVGTSAMSMATAMLAGVFALRSLRHIEPISLLR